MDKDVWKSRAATILGVSIEGKAEGTVDELLTADDTNSEKYYHYLQQH